MDGDRVSCLMLMVGLNREEFAALLGVERMTVWRWEQGRARPRREQAELMERLWRALLELAEGEAGELVLAALEQRDRAGWWRGWIEGQRTKDEGQMAGMVGNE